MWTVIRSLIASRNGTGLRRKTGREGRAFKVGWWERVGGKITEESQKRAIKL